jgi:DNA invertase Pin-like site-specific DNA recombinase
MGRLTLNVLLSFAQFEREVIGERVRDKIAASKAKGLWVGGSIPLGYASINKKLVVVAEEAETVRLIFRRYLELGSIRDLADDLDRQGIRTRRQTLSTGQIRGSASAPSPIFSETAFTLVRSSIGVRFILANTEPFSSARCSMPCRLNLRPVPTSDS